jgi:hypothetical protein
LTSALTERFWQPLEEEPVPVPADDGSAAQLGAADALAPADALEAAVGAVPAWDAAPVLELPEEQAVRVRPVASEIAASPAFVMMCTNRPFAYTCGNLMTFAKTKFSSPRRA